MTMENTPSPVGFYQEIPSKKFPKKFLETVIDTWKEFSPLMESLQSSFFPKEFFKRIFLLSVHSFMILSLKISRQLDFNP